MEKDKPYLTENGALIISSDVDPKYKWWAGGQSIKQTLEELEAPQEVIKRYIDQKKGIHS